MTPTPDIPETPAEATSPGEVTRLLQAASAGDEAAMGEVMARMYETLHRMAAAQLRHERDCTLSATELVNEAFLRVFAGTDLPEMQNRGHLIGLAARAMRRVLIDAARRRQAQKRPNAFDRVGLTEIASSLGENTEPDELDDALQQLEEIDARQAMIVEMRFFVGLREEEIGVALGISPRTVQREWRIAREWLKRELSVV
jgi:RNA polymerase sigma factor (TIGR02999 family)